MNDLVLDASAALALVLRREGSDRIADLLDNASVVAAPRLFCAEVANALWKYVRGGHLDEAVAIERLRECLALVVHPFEDAELAPEALRTAVRFGHPVYDALYATLATRITCAVVTRDQRLVGLLDDLRIDHV